MAEFPLYSHPILLPRVAIEYCTQCRWMLRAAYYAQELLSTFSTSIGEIALIPRTGGIFTITLSFRSLGIQSVEETDSLKPNVGQTVSSAIIWDRKRDGGFPETKILKQKIRDFIEPGKNLGHSDTPSSKALKSDTTETIKVEDLDKPIGQTDHNVPISITAESECKSCE